MMTRSNGQFHVPTLAIIGVGMIGGSLSLGLKQRHCVDRVVGYGRNRANLDQALSLGAIDEIADSPLAAAGAADIVVLATPVGAMAGLLAEILPVIDNAKIVTDVGSVKKGVAEQAVSILGDKASRFVPGHPVAGKEHTGVAAATQDLFEDHKVAITPLDQSDPAAVQRVIAMWEAVGAETVTMGVGEHDRVLGMTSHLPHVLAYAMVLYFANTGDREKCYEMAGGGFYDFTRIASSDPVMWRDICRMNLPEVLGHIAGFQQQLDTITGLLESGDDDQIQTLFAAAREARSKVGERRKAVTNVDDEAVALGKRRIKQLVNR